MRDLNTEIRVITLRDLAPAQIERAEVELLNERGLAPATVKKAHRVLRQCLMHAVNMEEIDRNSTARVKPPKAEVKQPNALDAATRTRLVTALSAMEPTPSGPP